MADSIAMNEINLKIFALPTKNRYALNKDQKSKRKLQIFEITLYFLA